jgi:hypothetical protein
VGHHENGVHVGINTAAPRLLAPWQELGLAVLVAGTIVAAVCGGIVAGLGTDIAGELRSACAPSN